MKWLVCQKLAAWLHVRVSSKTLSPSVVYSTEVTSDTQDFEQDGQQLQDITLGTTDKLLMEIRDLLQRKIGNKAEEPVKPDEDNENENDWKLAAKVIDRILLIIFSILLVGGTVVFFATFAAGYYPHN